MRALISFFAELLCKPQPSLLAISIAEFTESNRTARHRALVANSQPPPARFDRRSQIRVVLMETGSTAPMPSRQMLNEQADALNTVFVFTKKGERPPDLDLHRHRQAKAA